MTEYATVSGCQKLPCLQDIRLQALVVRTLAHCCLLEQVLSTGNCPVTQPGCSQCCSTFRCT